MGQSIIQVDAFTNVPFRGNPAAVCLMQAEAGDEWLQDIAAEMNLSETAFLLSNPSPGVVGEEGVADYSLRWFTPDIEVDLCGHATLASAHVLWSEKLVSTTEKIRFHTKSGLLAATLASGLDGDWITLNFPSQAVSAIDAPPSLAKALGGKVLGVYANETNYLVEVASEAELRTLRPDLPTLAQLPRQGVIVTACGSGPYDFFSRYFAPQAGIDEDPVTGSAHCSLVPFWKARMGKSKLLAYQASARGGVLKVADLGERVAISGQAVTVMRGELIDN